MQSPYVIKPDPMGPFTAALSTDFTEIANTITDTGLAFTPAANSVYLVEAFLLFKTDAVTTGMQWTFSGPASGATTQSQVVHVPTSTTAEVAEEGLIDVVAAGTAVAATTTTYLATGQCVVITGATPVGAVKVRAKSEVNTSVLTVLAGSFIRVTKIS